MESFFKIGDFSLAGKCIFFSNLLLDDRAGPDAVALPGLLLPVAGEHGSLEAVEQPLQTQLLPVRVALPLVVVVAPLGRGGVEDPRRRHSQHRRRRRGGGLG